MPEAADFLDPVAPGRASRQIVDQILDLLRSGRLTAGSRLPPERQLAGEFGVSRVTVRDAMRVLEAQGLVTVKVGASGGAFLTAPSTDVLAERLYDLLALSTLSPEDVAEARLVMELGILGLVVARATGDDLRLLRGLCEQAGDALAAGRYDPQVANEFHARLAFAARNGAVTRIAESFRGPLRMAAVRAREPADDAHQRTVEDHFALIDALDRRDLDTARRVMAHHLTRGTSLRATTVPQVGGVRGRLSDW